MNRAIFVRLLALLVVFATAVPAGAFARVQYFCRMMDAVVESTCCCGDDDEREVSSSSAELWSASCCDRIDAATPDAAPATPAVGADLPVPAFLAALHATPTFDDPYRQPSTSAPPSARAPPAFGPPLFIQHRALLT